MTGAPVSPGPVLDGRLAVVTGSSRGLGRALAEGLAEAGADVVINGTDADRVSRAAAELQDALAARGVPRAVHAMPFDVADPDAVERAARVIEDRHGPVEIVVNNAGIQRRGPLVELSVQDWQQVIDVNLTAAFLVGRAFARPMLGRGHGKIINVCSVQSAVVRPTTAPYATSKGGLRNLTQSMCAEWAPAGLQVNGIAPGYLATELNTELMADPEFDAWITARTPARRWGTVQDVVGPAVWLSSPAADFVNGQVIYVDGGLTAVI